MIDFYVFLFDLFIIAHIAFLGVVFLNLRRNTVVYKVRMHFIHNSWDEFHLLPSYDEMKKAKYWLLRSPEDWMKWIERKRNTTVV